MARTRRLNDVSNTRFTAYIKSPATIRWNYLLQQSGIRTNKNICQARRVIDVRERAYLIYEITNYLPIYLNHLATYLYTFLPTC